MVIPPEFLRTLDESIRPLLTDARDIYFRWLEYSTFAVGFGVVLEGLEVIHDTKEEVHKFRIGFPRRTDVVATRHRLNRVLLISLLGWLLVSVGVLGEFWFEIKVSQYDKTLRLIDDNLLAQTGLEAADAIERAAEASERAGNAELRAATLLKEIQPRDLTEEERNNLLALKRRFSGSKVQIASFSGDIESARFARQIESSLKDAGLIVEEQIAKAGFIGNNKLLYGLQVGGGELADSALIKALYQSLSSPTPYSFPGVLPLFNNEPVIFVGVKPLPDATDARATR
jgi:hypothetical protein